MLPSKWPIVTTLPTTIKIYYDTVFPLRQVQSLNNYHVMIQTKMNKGLHAQTINNLLLTNFFFHPKKVWTTHNQLGSQFLGMRFRSFILKHNQHLRFNFLPDYGYWVYQPPKELFKVHAPWQVYTIQCTHTGQCSVQWSVQYIVHWSVQYSECSVHTRGETQSQGGNQTVNM